MTMRLPALAALSLGLAACGGHSTYEAVSIENPVIRLSAVAGQPAAGYLKIAATKDHLALTGVSAPRAAKVEMHETMASGAMSTMRPIERIDLAGGGEIRFAPGGRHLMLFGLDPKLKPGDHANLILHFARGDPVTASAAVIAAGDEPAH
jgi:copper(I)-binding protein